MALEIQYSQDIKTPYTAWFMYSAMGGGKTRSCATFPSPLFLVPANENSQLTLRQLAEKNLPYILIGKNRAGAVVDARQHMSEVLGELERLYHAMLRDYTAAEVMKEETEEEKTAKNAAIDAALALFPWQTIVVESLSHLSDKLVESITDNGKKKMDQQGWGLLATFFSQMHSRLKNMDVHIVYTALAKSETNDEGGVIGGSPMLSGQTATKLPAMCDVVCYMEELDGGKNPDGSKKAVYRTFFRKYRVWPARTRFAGFPDFMDNFDFAALAKLIA